MNVIIWNEYRHERANPQVREIYPDGIHGALRDGLRQHDIVAEHVPRLAALSRDRPLGASIFLHAGGGNDFVPCSIKGEPGIVGHSAVDADVVPHAGDPFRALDRVERHAGAADDRSPGFVAENGRVDAMLLRGFQYGV